MNVKRIFCLLLFFIMLANIPLAGAEGVLPAMMDETAYGAADSAGEVVNTDAPDVSDDVRAAYAFTPLDVVLVLDASGSMEQQNASNGKPLISYAQDAAITFAETLFAINPDSRVGVVQYDTNVVKVIDLCTSGQANTLHRAIRGITTGGRTNTGGAYQMAVDMLNQQARPEAQSMILMLSDGLANEGASDPVGYAIESGYLAAQNSAVYTVGLVGGLSRDEKEWTRQVLSAGYEQQYYEVDFDEVGNIGVQLAMRFTAACADASLQENQQVYLIWADGSLDLYIENSSGDYLSSGLGGERTVSSFGRLSYLGDENDEKLALIIDDVYRIRLHGMHTAQGQYSITRLTPGLEEILTSETLAVHPALCYELSLSGRETTRHDYSYDPLNHNAIDPFTGAATRGLELPVLYALRESATVMAATGSKAASIEKLSRGIAVSLLAVDPDTGWMLIGYLSKENGYSRGWIAPVETDGYVPNMFWLTGEYSLLADTMTYRAPTFNAAQVENLTAGSMVVLRHAERDRNGREWAYVQIDSSKPTYVYLPADQLLGWDPICSLDFQMGYAAPIPVWEGQLGRSGYTEIMWAAPTMEDVVLSGRTSSSSGAMKAKQGNRDSFAIRLGEDGSLLHAVTAGGSDWDSYHCIVPADAGFYVSGVTRSNNGDFADIWDPSSHTNSASSTTKKTNALIGRLNDDFSIDWLKSFGTGKVSYGFDMVVETTDGNIVGAGWLIDSSSGTLRGYGEQDFYVVKLTPDGEVLQARCYGSGANEVPDSAAATPDGGLIMVGSSNDDGFILVLDADLNIVNQCRYGGSGEDIFDNIRLLSDGTYLVTGFTDSPSGNGVGGTRGGSDFWVMNIDSLGRSIWMRRIGGSGDEELCGTVLLDDGTCLLLGSTESDDGDVRGKYSRNEEDAWAVCIDTNGRLLWQYLVSASGDDRFNTAAVDPRDGCYVLAGICNHEDSSHAEGLIVKINPPVNSTEQ